MLIQVLLNHVSFEWLTRMFEPLGRTGLSLERLRSFLEVVKGGGMAHADGNRSPSQLSRQVRELEDAFGCALIERRGRGIVVTAAGHQLAQIVRESFKGLEDFALEQKSAALPFTLGAGDSLLHWLVVPRIGHAIPRHLRATATLVSLSSGDVVERLLDAQLDVGIVRGSVVRTPLRKRSLGVLRYALYAPKRLLGELSRDPAELLATLPLAVQRSEPALNAGLLALAKKHGGPQIALECETFPQACRALLGGSCAALLPTIARVDLPPEKFAEVTLPGLTRLDTTLHLAWHPRAERTRLRRLLDALEAGLKVAIPR